MAKTLVIAEKPSVDVPHACASGQFAKHEGYLESETHVVTWAVGHLVSSPSPTSTTRKYKKWRMADLPIVPDEFRLVVRDERRRSRCRRSRSCSAEGRRPRHQRLRRRARGELIFAWTFEKAGAKKPVMRLWLSSMTARAIKQAFAALRPAEELARLEQAARSRSEADWIVGMIEGVGEAFRPRQSRCDESKQSPAVIGVSVG